MSTLAPSNNRHHVLRYRWEIPSVDQVIVEERAGANFIKTSMDHVTPAATMPVTLVMLKAIRDYFYETGVRIGMKPAGGIRTAKQALAYLVMLKETLGDDWLTSDLSASAPARWRTMCSCRS